MSGTSVYVWASFYFECQLAVSNSKMDPTRTLTGVRDHSENLQYRSQKSSTGGRGKGESDRWSKRSLHELEHTTRLLLVSPRGAILCDDILIAKFAFY